MRKLLSAVIAIGLALSSIFSINVNADEGLTSKAVLMKNIQRMYPEMEVRSSFYDDFDGDGKKELFVISGSFDEVDAAHGIYYSSYNTTKRLADNIGYLLKDSDATVATLSNKQKLFYTEVSFGGSGSWTYCYYVNDGVPCQVEQELSGLTQIMDDDFMICGDAFDAMKSDKDGTAVGHTWKMYYVKWNDGAFKEYSASYIKQAAFEKYTGAASVLAKIKKKGYKVDKIIKRDNGVININVSKKKKKTTYYHNLTLSLINNKVSLMKVSSSATKFWDKYSFGGVYRLYILK